MPWEEAPAVQAKGWVCFYWKYIYLELIPIPASFNKGESMK